MSSNNVNHPCRGCYYWRGGDADACCYYLFIEDHRLPCPGGEGCTEYIKYRDYLKRKNGRIAKSKAKTRAKAKKVRA